MKLPARVFYVICTAAVVLSSCSDFSKTVSESQNPAATPPEMVQEGLEGISPLTPTVVDVAERESPAQTKGVAMPAEKSSQLADVISVQVSGSAGAYQFSVGISSPDTGCDQYADWWEVVSEQGELIYRRVLLHSHVGEQPFVRSGGPVEIGADAVLWVRAHMNPGGYGGLAFQGSVQGGFTQAEPPPNFAENLENEPPLPDGCAF